MKIELSKDDINGSYKKLLDKSRLDFGFVFLAFISIFICVLGFAINSASVIIGSMLVSPLLYPILSIPATVFWKDYKFFSRKSMWMLLVIFCLILFSTFLKFLFIEDFGSEIIERINSNILVYFFIALASGAGGAFSLFWPHVVEAIPGVAISVALLPPIAIVGFAFASGDLNMLKISSIILTLNLLGIVLGSTLVIGVLKKLQK